MKWWWKGMKWLKNHLISQDWVFHPFPSFVIFSGLGALYFAQWHINDYLDKKPEEFTEIICKADKLKPRALKDKIYLYVICDKQYVFDETIKNVALFLEGNTELKCKKYASRIDNCQMIEK
jgi:hypothetical protein